MDLIFAEATKERWGIPPRAFDLALIALSHAVGSRVIWVRGVDLASGAAPKAKPELSQSPAMQSLRDHRDEVRAADAALDVAQAGLHEAVRVAKDEGGESLNAIAAVLNISAPTAKRFYSRGRRRTAWRSRRPGGRRREPQPPPYRCSPPPPALSPPAAALE